MESELELAWAAGFFDGEGSTSVLKAQRDKYAYVRMSVSQKQPECLERFKAAVGGYGKIYKSNTRNIHSWDCYRKDQVDIVIDKLYPFLSIHKRKQIDDARVRAKESA